MGQADLGPLRASARVEDLAPADRRGVLAQRALGVVRRGPGDGQLARPALQPRQVLLHVYPDAALDALSVAIENGYPRVMLVSEPLLGDLQGTDRFSTLVIAPQREKAGGE